MSPPMRLRLIEVFTANLDGEAAVGIAAAERARQLLIAAGGARGDDRAGNADDDAPEVGGNLIVRARPLVAWRTSLTVTLTLDADPPMNPPPPAELMMRGRLRHVGADQLFEALRDLLAALDARAVGQARGNRHLALVGLRHEFRGNRRQDQERRDRQRRRARR